MVFFEASGQNEAAVCVCVCDLQCLLYLTGSETQQEGTECTDGGRNRGRQ